MKKITFFSAIALTLALGACDNFDLPNPPGQSYPAPDGYFENSSLVMSANTEALNLTEANAANEFVTLATISELVNFPEGYDLVVDMNLGSGSKAKTYSTTLVDNKEVTIDPTILNGAVQDVLTKAPGTYTLPVSFSAYAVRGTTRMGLGGLNATYGNGDLTVKTYDAAKVIEDAYYFVPVLNGKADMSKAKKMNNTAGNGVSPYDNPEFALQIEVPEDSELFFVIAPQSALTAGENATIYGGNPSADEMSGKLGTSYGVIKMPVAGSVLVTVNMEADSYTINYAFSVLYAVSGATKPANAMPLYTDNFINYYGVTALNQKFTVYTSADKKGVAFKWDESVETELSENGLELSGAITADSSVTAQIPAPIKGNCLYYVDLNLVLKTYTLKALQTMTVIGSGNGWNLETATPLTPSKDLKTWTATDVEIGDNFKINCNGAWDYDFGGVSVPDVNGQSVYNLNFKGSNMEATPGKYDVKIDFSTLPYVLTLTKK
ncbi:MAG: hypothetical protein K2M31_01995 [Muribaculaceae bacterium]|nr:hypothetical protein [Muribaculaceae bacterium]